MENSDDADGSSDGSDFIATEDMLSHDLDDESTINEDEEIHDDQEIDNLKAEGDMPLEELLKKYGQYLCNPEGETSENNTRESDKDDEDDTNEDIQENNERATPPRSNISSRLWCKDLIECNSNYNSEDDGDYIPKVDSKNLANAKTRIGAEYQAEIPVGLVKKPTRDYYNNSLRNYEIILWSDKPRISIAYSCTDTKDEAAITEKEIEDYLRQYGSIAKLSDVMLSGKDDYMALYRLMENDFDVEESLNYIRNRAVKPGECPSAMEMWTEHEVSEFEKGFEQHSKNFRLIHEQRVRTKSLPDIIQYYYFWKKTKRYEEFARVCKREKKRPLNQITDYTDCLATNGPSKEKYLLGNWLGIIQSVTNTNDDDNQNADEFNKLFGLSTSEAPGILEGKWDLLSSSISSKNTNIIPTNSNNESNKNSTQEDSNKTSS